MLAPYVNEFRFLHGGTIFTLPDDVAPGLDRARAEAASLAYEIGILGRVAETPAAPVAPGAEAGLRTAA